MSQINITNLTFSYDSCFENIFEDVSFSMDTNWKLGFTGRNGRGKTTFLQLLLGKYDYSGNISASVLFDYFPFEVQDRNRLTLEILEETAPEAELWQIQRELSLIDLPEEILDHSFSDLSNGEQTKVLLVALFLKENNFLLIDEPTNHLDVYGREVVSKYLKGKKGFILVSHDRVFLDQCIDHILSINKCGIEIQKGDFSTWQENKRRQDESELAENEKLKKDIKKLEEAARRTERWSDQVEKTKSGKSRAGQAGVKPDKGAIGHKAAKMMKRSKNLEKRQHGAIAQKEELLSNIEEAGNLSIKPLAYRSKRLIEAVDLSVYYGEKKVAGNVSFSLDQGERLAITGKNGAGKSSILKLLAGNEVPLSGLRAEALTFKGELRIGSGLTVSYISQDTSFLKGNLKDFARKEGIDESLFKAILRKLDFSRTQFDKEMEEFSGGQKKKVLLAKSLCQSTHLYIWDEPLNFIDVISRMQIEDLIVKHNPTMIFVEHDSSFCRTIATRELQLGSNFGD